MANRSSQNYEPPNSLEYFLLSPGLASWPNEEFEANNRGFRQGKGKSRV